MNKIWLLSIHVIVYGLILVFAQMPMTVLLISLVLGGLLIAISQHDFRTYEIPDVLNILLVVSGLGATWLLMPEEVLIHVGAAVVWGLFFWGLSEVFLRLRGVNGLGLGDAKLTAGIGAWLGLWPVTSVVFLASLTGILFVFVVARIQNVPTSSLPIAFAPFLCLTTWWVWVFGPICIWCI